jgi:D-alanyl-lipoteichoic acid acyltransferase DltB (MBOAT superfamily)
MNVPSYEFLGFAAVVAIAINCSRASGWRRAVLLVANLAFILSFTHDPRQLAPFAALLFAGYGCMKLVERSKQRVVFAAICVGIVFAFCCLKRYAFIPSDAFLPFAYFTVGMSYVFFRVLHLIIDAYQDALPQRVGPVDYVNYTLNFTSLVAGPIQFYRDYHRFESVRPAPLGASDAAIALRRILVGFFKVSIVSPLLAHAQAILLANLSASGGVARNAADAALLTAVFLVYLYFNFSGYTDFVIGVARFLRLELPENFNRPFMASGFIDFWGRWHITLANWAKTYVYSPLLLALMRRYPSPSVAPVFGVLAYFVTFFFVGVWHGQTSMFIFLGVLLGFGVSVNKLYEIAMTRRLGRARYGNLCANPVHAALSRGATLAYFAFASLWFWSTWAQLGTFVASLGVGGVALALALLFAGATILLAMLKAAADALTMLEAQGPLLAPTRYARIALYSALAVLLVSVTVILNSPAPHIVYKGF